MPADNDFVARLDAIGNDFCFGRGGQSLFIRDQYSRPAPFNRQMRFRGGVARIFDNIGKAAD